MADLLVQAPTLGIDGSLSANQIDDRAASEGTQNVEFDNGEVKPPKGFAKWDCASPLVAEEPVTGLCSYVEVGIESGNTNIVATTNSKVCLHDIVNSTWVVLGGNGLDADVFHPVTFASILHTDAINTTEFQHLVISDGGKSDIIRYKGQGANCEKLVGGGGYHASETHHRTLQIVGYQNRLVLISPQEEAGGIWIPNPSRVRWPMIGKLETWTGTGSGFADLIDTGDINVRAALLSNTLIVYQKHSTWQLRYVGGTTVFTPDILLPNIGLLAWNLLISTESVHYFVGNDYNIYSYRSGSYIEDIGKPIANMFKDDLDATKAYRCRAIIGPQQKEVWFLIVEVGGQYATRGYKYNIQTGAWTVRDFDHAYSISAGLTAVALVGSAIYTTGQSYAVAATEAKTYGEVAAGTSITLTESPVTGTTWTGSGTIMTNGAAKWKTAGAGLVSVGDIVHVASGTGATAGWRRVVTVTSDTELIIESGTGASPSSVTYTIHKDDGASYASTLQEVRVGDQLIVGDSDGYILKESDTLYTDNGFTPTRRFISKEFDGGESQTSKRIDTVLVEAKGTSVTIEYKLDNGTWTTLATVTLTDDYAPYRRFINKTARKAQLRLSGLFWLRSYGFLNIQPEAER
jgi:hypothetical protein